jgi:hypothetical protein
MTQEHTLADPGATARPVVALLPYPGMTLLYLVGPLGTRSEMTDVHLFAVTTPN